MMLCNNTICQPLNCLKMKMTEKVLKNDLSAKESDYMSLLMTSFFNRFLHYDDINSVIIIEIQLLF